MELKDTYVADMKGGVFYDKITAIAEKSQWAEIAENTRSDVKTVLGTLGIQGKLEPTIESTGFEYKYTVDEMTRTVAIDSDSLTFEVGRFLFSKGPSLDICSVIDRILEKIGRADWNIIGTIVGFAIPLTVGKETNLGASTIIQNFLAETKNGYESVFSRENAKVVNLTIKGTVDDQNIQWSVYNTKEQHIILTLDVQVERHKMRVKGIEAFVSNVFEIFKEKCGPLLESILSSPTLMSKINTDFLTKGFRL